MPVLTILNQGTANDSTDPNLVVSRLESIMAAPANEWMITQGVGTAPLTAEMGYLPYWGEFGGIMWGKGLEKNVQRGVDFVRNYINNNHIAPNAVTVNMCGHSRGSITCFKQANELYRLGGNFQQIRVNIFAIDPVCGNLGAANNSVYKHIKHLDNIKACYMFLSEHERRDAFRPVIDQKFMSADRPSSHLMDTIPGNHAGIVSTGAVQNESALVLLELARQFLSAHGTEFAVKNSWADANFLHLYAKIMNKLGLYKQQGRWYFGSEKDGDTPLKNQLFPGGTSDSLLHSGDRIFQAKNPSVKLSLSKTGRNIPFLEKNKYEGKALKKEFKNLSAQHRFFANNHHRVLFSRYYPNTYSFVRLLELRADAFVHFAMNGDPDVQSEYNAFSLPEKTHFDDWRNSFG